MLQKELWIVILHMSPKLHVLPCYVVHAFSDRIVIMLPHTLVVITQLTSGLGRVGMAEGDRGNITADRG